MERETNGNEDEEGRQKIREEKARKRGGFEKRILLEEVVEDDE